jgi:hypothetical protein
MNTRRQFLLAIPVFLAYCTSKKKMTEEEIKKLQEGADQYHKTLDKNLISEGHPIAKTFKYRKDGTTASALLGKSERAGIPADKQFCNNCIYYKAIGDDYGSCQLLPQGNVTSIGWCFSWAINKRADLDNAATVN